MRRGEFQFAIAASDIHSVSDEQPERHPILDPWTGCVEVASDPREGGYFVSARLGSREVWFTADSCAVVTMSRQACATLPEPFLRTVAAPEYVRGIAQTASGVVWLLG